MIEEERFVIARSSGYAEPGAKGMEKEWAVCDTWENWRVVAIFWARHAAGMTNDQWNTLQAERRRRAQLYCLSLNRAERGEHFGWGDLRIEPRLNERGPALDEIRVSA